MKRVIFYILLFVFCLAVILVLPTAGEEAIYDDIIRLHVIAASDSDEDQKLKLAVRDAILEDYGELLASCDDIDVARKSISELITNVRASASRVLTEAGCRDSVTVSFGEEIYPTRYYENFSVPAGKYLSLKVIIGEGKGKNWWCVLFPPLCVSSAVKSENATDAVPNGLTREEYLIMNSADVRYRIKFRSLEWIESAFHKN